jgi:hypothetical protein
MFESAATGQVGWRLEVRMNNVILDLIQQSVTLMHWMVRAGISVTPVSRHACVWPRLELSWQQALEGRQTVFGYLL